MNDGNIEQIGTPMELFNNPANIFVASFIGSPPMNQMPGKITNSPAGLTATVNDIAITLPDNINVEEGQPVVVGVRPEHLTLDNTGNTLPIPISLDLVEPLGSEALLHASIGENQLIVKAETNGDIEHLNNVTEVFAPPHLVSIFDAETGTALTGKHG